MWDEYRKEIEQLHLDDSVIKDIQQNLLKSIPMRFGSIKGNGLSLLYLWRASV